MMNTTTAKRPEFAPSWPYHQWPIYSSGKKKTSCVDKTNQPPDHWNKSLEIPVKLNSELDTFIRDVASKSRFPRTDSDIIPIVCKMVKSTADVLAKHNQLFHNVSVLHAGSIVEQTRISKLDEFDFIYLLDEEIVKENMKFCFNHDHFALKSRTDLVEKLLQSSGNFKNSIILECFKQTLPPGWSLGDHHEFTYSNALCVHLLPPDTFAHLRHVAVDICIAMPIGSSMIDEILPIDRYNAMIQTLKFYNSLQKRIIAILRFTRKTVVTKRFVLRDHELNLFEGFEDDDGRLVCYRVLKYIFQCHFPTFFAIEEYRDFTGSGTCHAYNSTKVDKPFSNVLDDWCEKSCYKTMVSSHGLKNIMLYMMQYYSKTNYWSGEHFGNRVLEVLLILKQIIVEGYSINMFYWRSTIELDYFNFSRELELIPEKQRDDQEATQPEFVHMANTNYFISKLPKQSLDRTRPDTNKYYWKDNRGALREINTSINHSPIIWTERMKHFETFPICYTVDDINAAVKHRVIFVRKPPALLPCVKFGPFVQKISKLIGEDLDCGDIYSSFMCEKKVWAPTEELYFVFSGFTWLVISSFWLSSALSTLVSTNAQSSTIMLPWWYLSTASSSELSLFWSWASSLSSCKENKKEKGLTKESDSLNISDVDNIDESLSSIASSSVQCDNSDSRGAHTKSNGVVMSKQIFNKISNVCRLHAADALSQSDKSFTELEFHLNTLDELSVCQKEVCTWLCLVSGLEQFRVTAANQILASSSQVYATIHDLLKCFFQELKQDTRTPYVHTKLCQKIETLKSHRLELLSMRQRLEEIIENTFKKSKSDTSFKANDFNGTSQRICSTHQTCQLTSRNLLYEFISCFETLDK